MTSSSNFLKNIRLERKFEELKDKKEGAYMAHVYYGDPDEDFSVKLVKTLVENGADIIELGIPFSDPTADGPTFQAACERALKNGVTPPKCIQGVKKLRKEGLKIPIIITTYYNILYAVGIENFLKEIKEAGVQAIIVPDLPFEESSPLLEAGRKNGIQVILQIAPTTTTDRLKRIIAEASGFLYIVNVEGVTGTREAIAPSTLKLIKNVRRYTNMPLIAGFGISKREHAVTMVSAGADGVVTGSTIAEIYAKNLKKPENALPAVATFVKEMKKGCVEGYAQLRV